jgi:nucleoside-diphosphate-sugar epimerase
MKSLNLISGSELESLKDRIDFDYFSGKRVLITGGAGMLGSWLATSIVSASSSIGSSKTFVDIVSRRSNPKNLDQALRFKNCKYIQGDVVSRKMNGYDLVIHAASPASPAHFGSLESMRSVNSGPISKLIESSPNLDQFIFISTGEVYGKSSPLNVEENFKSTEFESSERSSYPLSKIAAEIELNDLADKHAFLPGIVRLFHSFGPGMSQEDGRSFPDFVWSAARGEPIQLYSDGSQTRSILYMEDAVVAILKIISKRFTKPVNVGSSTPVTIKQLANLVTKIADLSQPIITVNNNFLPSPNNVSVPSNKLLRTLGWEQKIDLDQCISRTLNWCKSALL